MMQRKSQAKNPSATLLLTTKEVSAKFGVSTNWIYMHKHLPAYRIGKALRFKESELLDYFRQKSLVSR